MTMFETFLQYLYVFYSNIRSLLNKIKIKVPWNHSVILSNILTVCVATANSVADMKITGDFQTCFDLRVFPLVSPSILYRWPMMIWAALLVSETTVIKMCPLIVACLIRNVIYRTAIQWGARRIYTFIYWRRVEKKVL